MHKVSEKKCTK